MASQRRARHRTNDSSLRIWNTDMGGTLWRAAVPVAVILLSADSVVLAHGLVSKRVFPATILTDDPFVADEISLPQATVNPPGPDGSRATDIQSICRSAPRPTLA